MKLVCKERLFSRFRGYRVYDDDGKLVFVVKSRPFLERGLDICDADGQRVACLQRQPMMWPKEYEMTVFDRYVGERYLGRITVEETLYYNEYAISCNGWCVNADPETRGYAVIDPKGKAVGFVEWRVCPFRRYVINVMNEEHALPMLMLALVTALNVRRAYGRGRFY